MDSGTAATLVAGTWLVVFIVLYVGFGGRIQLYRYPVRLIIAATLAFIVAMVLAFVLFAQPGVSVHLSHMLTV